MDENVVYEEKEDEFDIVRLPSDPRRFLIPMRSFDRKMKRTFESEK